MQRELLWGCPQCSEPHLALAKRYEDNIVFDTERRHTLQQQAINVQFISLPRTGVKQSPRSGEKKTWKSRHSNSQRKTSREINTHTIHLLMLPYKTAWLFPGHDNKTARFIRHSRAERKQLWCFVKARQLRLLLVDLAVYTPHCDCMHRSQSSVLKKSFQVLL